MDKDANANGGMLVIATSVPDEREWIQWRGRTARQDRPGQCYSGVKGAVFAVAWLELAGSADRIGWLGAARAPHS